MNFLEAINAHVAWKLRLQRYLEGTSEENLDPSHICKDNQCVLGKWIYGNESRFSQSTVFHEVKGKHAEFHQLAAGIVQLINDNRKQEASATLQGDYARLSQYLIKQIRTMARDLNNRI